MSRRQDRDPWQSPEFKAFAARWGEQVYPMLASSAASLVISGPPGEADLQQAVEIGMSLLLDKPLIIVCPPGRVVPAQLRRVANAVIEGEPGTPGFDSLLSKALAEVGIETTL